MAATPYKFTDRRGTDYGATNKLYEAATPKTARRALPRSDYDSRKNLSAMGWRDMMSAGRFLYANLGAVRGAVNEKANYAVGTGWIPQFKGTDKKWGAKAEAWLWEWMKICDLRGAPYNFHTGLQLASIAIDRDGDFGMLLTENADGYPLIQYIPAHRIGGRAYAETVITEGPYKGYPVCNGVISNEYGRPIAYQLNNDDYTDGKFEYREADDMALVYAPEYFDAARGITALSHCINDFADVHDIRDFHKMAVKIESAIGLIEENEAGQADTGQSWVTQPDAGTDTDGSAAGLITETMEGGMIRYFKSKSGSGIKPFESTRPHPNILGFLEWIQRGCFAGLEWPIELSWDPKEIGGANTRLITAKAQRTIEKRQAVLKTVAKRKIGYALSKAVKLGLLEDSPEWWMWDFQMPRSITVDEGRVAQANRDDMLFGIRTHAEDAAERGRDWEEDREQSEREATDLIIRADRMSQTTGKPFEFCISLLQQRTPNGNMPIVQPAPASKEISK